MKKPILILTLLLALSGCGQTDSPAAPETAAPSTVPETAAPAGDRNPTAEELGRADKKDLTIMVEGTEEAVPATLYIGQGYSIYIPDEGWRLEKDTDDGIPEDTWESTVNGDVELTVSHYSGKTWAEARDAFARDKDYVFEDLMGGKLGDPLTGMDEDGDYMSFMVAEGAGTVYVISWEYPAEAAEGFGARLGRIADTFEIMN